MSSVSCLHFSVNLSHYGISPLVFYILIIFFQLNNSKALSPIIQTSGAYGALRVKETKSVASTRSPY